MKTEIIQIDPHAPDARKIISCAKVIRQGGLVVFPTETVYGIAADFSNPKAVKRLRSVKKRSEEKPISVLISQLELISNYSSMTDPILYKLIGTYWPGPLTVVVPAREEGKTIGVRMPDHPIALKLVKESQCTIAAPSANFEGNPPPSTCQEALKDLDGLVDIAIDGGASKIGQGSSVVDLTQENPVVLREGVIKQEDVDEIARKKDILFVCTGNSCRSVMAEYLLQNVVKERDDVNVYSAGVNVFVHSTASSETIMLLKEEGIDAVDHLSRPLNTTLLKSADLIFVMTRLHRQQVLERAPEVERRIYLLREFVDLPIVRQEDMDIPDPIGRGSMDYQECFSIIKEAVQKIVNLI